MSSMRLLWVCATILLGAAGSGVHATPLFLDNSTDVIGFSKPSDMTYAFGEPAKTTPPSESEFKPLSRWHLPGTTQTLWLRFEVQFDSQVARGEPFFLEADERPDQVRLFRGTPPYEQLATSGTLVPLSEREPSDRRILVPLIADPGKVLAYYVAIDATVPIGTDFRVHSNSELRASAHRQELKLSIYAGFLAALFLINILLFLYTREGLYLNYACVQPWYLIFPAWELGFGLYLGPSFGPWYQFIGEMNGALSILALGLFGLRFTRVYFTHRKLFLMILSSAILAPVAILVIPMPTEVPYFLEAITLLGLVSAGILAARRGDRSARIWTVGMAVVVINGLFAIFNEIGALPFNLTLEDIVTLLSVSALIESVAFCVSVSERLNEEATQLMDKQSHLIRRLEEQRQIAQSANLAKEQFLRNTSHELRTPLTAIAGYADLILDHDDGTDNHASVIKRNALHLDQILKSIVEFSSAQQGALSVVPAPFDICEGLEEVVELLRPEARRRKIEIFNQCEVAGPILVLADRERVRQILWNLLGNAVRFTSNGYIHAGVERNGEQIRVWVRDTGVGMEPSVQSTLFKEFTQGDGSLTRAKQGLGLGLALSRELARLQGGDVRLAWSRPAVGSQFEILLPAAKI